MDGIFLGIDCGTQSTRAIALDAGSARVLGSASRPLSFLPGLPPGHAEQDPRVWVAATREALLDLLARIDRRAVRGLGVSAQQHGFVPLDGRDEPIRPAKLWCDTSSAPQCARLLERLGGPGRFRDLTGNALPPGYTASKILWLKEREPENFARLRGVLLPHDFLNLRFTGEKAAEPGDASGTALLDVRSRRWRVEVCEAIDPGLASALPPLRDSLSILAPLRPSVADDLGLPRGVLVSLGSGDNMMGAIGTGNVREGILTASLGTSGTVYAYAPRPVVDPAGEVAAFCDGTGAWLPLACTMNVTVATSLALAAFGRDLDSLDPLVESVEPGAGGLLCLPYFEGERTPNLPEGTGVLFGLRGATFDPAHALRAAMEGATLGLNYGLRRLRALGVAPLEIRLTGGAARSVAWRRIAADVFGCPVVCPEFAEGAALGAAIQALAACAADRGGRSTLEELCGACVRLDESTRVEPDPGRVGLYRELQGLHDRLSSAVRGCFPLHRAFLERR
ncbi:MAG TPA: xylulokinase [Planctomycetota bacterium]|nr:xylulokinase [Planctomycetota bacterium]